MDTDIRILRCRLWRVWFRFSMQVELSDPIKKLFYTVLSQFVYNVLKLEILAWSVEVCEIIDRKKQKLNN
jgi:hypothetical protein